MNGLFDEPAAPEIGGAFGVRPSPGLAHAGAAGPELQAAEAIAPVRKNLAMRVLAWIRASGTRGATCPELGELYARELGERPSAKREYSVRPRVTELHRAGYVDKAGGERGGATVWIAVRGKAGDGSDVKQAPRQKKPRPTEEDLRLPAALFPRLEAAAGGILARRKSDGVVLWIPGPLLEDDHPGRFVRAGVALDILAIVPAPDAPGGGVAGDFAAALAAARAELAAEVTR